MTPGTFPPLEVAADDLIAVLDAAGSRQAAIFGGAEAGWVASIAAATHPDRFSALILYQAAATWAKTNETPWNLSPTEWEAQEPYWLGAGTVMFYEDWIRQNAPSLAGDPGAAEYLAKLSRGTIGVGGGLAEFRRYNSTDIRAILPAIHVPTLVLNRPTNTTEHPRTGGSWHRSSPMRVWLSFRVPTTCRGRASPRRCSMRSRNSLPAPSM